MRKDAGLSDTYDAIKSHPVGAIGHAVAGMIPGVGGVTSAADMAQNLYKGNWASAGLDAVNAVAGLVPGGTLMRGLTRLGRPGKAMAKALPYMAPTVGAWQGSAGNPNPFHAKTMTGQIMQHAGSMIPRTMASIYDQEQQNQRPGAQLQMQEHQNMMRDFNEWRQHRQTLQNMNQPQPQHPDLQKAAASSSSISASVPSSIPVATPVGVPIPGHGEVGSKTKSIAKGIAPYILAASIGQDMLPAFYNSGGEKGYDYEGMGAGALTGLGGTTGAIGGMFAGSQLGLGAGNALATMKGPTWSPTLTGYGGAAIGGALGGLLGHQGGRALVRNLMGYGDQSKYASAPSLLALREKSASKNKDRKHAQGMRDKAVSRTIDAGGNPNSATPFGAMRRGRAARVAREAMKAPTPTPETPKPALEAPKTERVPLPVVEAPTLAAPTAPVPPTPVPGIGEPGRTALGPMPKFPAPGGMERLMSHPLTSFLGRQASNMGGFVGRHPIATTAGALGTLGLGAYLAGRGKRKNEDAEAEQAMAANAQMA